MDEQDYNVDQDSYDASSTTGNSNNISNSVTAVKDRVTAQASDLKEKITAKTSDLGNQLTQKIDSARGKTSAGLRTTSERMQNLALYMDEHDAKDMSDAVVSTTKELIRKHPGKSLLVGLIAGLLVGRIFSAGDHSNR